jgi:hypothetical protein
MSAQHPITPSSIRTIRQGHFANCSATGSVVGVALLSVVAVGAIVNAFADRFARWSATPEGPDEPPDGGDPSGPPGPRHEPGGAPARTPRVRPEGDGAIVAWPSPPALIDVDADTARALLQRGARAVGGDLPVPGALSAPTEVHVALSARCAAGCTGCYQDARPDGPATDAAALEEDLDALAQMGVFEIAVGGGEPLRSPDLVGVVEGIVRRGLVANVTTSGLGLDAARARWLAAHTGQVNVSLDGLGGVYAAARGWDGAPVALRALRLLREAGARVGGEHGDRRGERRSPRRHGRRAVRPRRHRVALDPLQARRPGDRGRRPLACAARRPLAPPAGDRRPHRPEHPGGLRPRAAGARRLPRARPGRAAPPGRDRLRGRAQPVGAGHRRHLRPVLLRRQPA